jgi:predicted transcriptional regulator of viral defense system
VNEIVTRLQNHDILTASIAEKAGMSKFKFYKFVKENGYEQISRGMYVAQDEWVDELYMIHQRCPQGVFSHDEAFYHYGLTDREPLVHTLTIYSGYNAHRLVADGYKVYTVKKELLEVGKTIVEDNCGNQIPMYDLERTICDLVRSRNSIEIQDFNSALKSYVSRKDKDLNILMEYAKLFRVDKILRKYMEVLL